MRISYLYNSAVTFESLADFISLFYHSLIWVFKEPDNKIQNYIFVNIIINFIYMNLAA